MLLLFGYIWVYMVIVDYLKEIENPVDKRGFLSCTHGTIRTCDLRIRSPLLYPAELRALRPVIVSNNLVEANRPLWAVNEDQ